MEKNLEINDSKIIGQRLKLIRIANNLTQAELAYKTELTPQYISLLETGRKSPSLNSLLKISHLLNISIDEFLYGISIDEEDDFSPRFRQLLSDCSIKEKQIIFETAISLKESLKRSSSIN